MFKLDEIDKRVNPLRPGQRVLDLGAAPGSWSMYASQKVGAKGVVLAIDLQLMTQQFLPNVRVIQGDVRELALELGRTEQAFDVVQSDMAPSTTGSKVSDQTGSFELFMSALEVAAALGKPGSSFVAKLFMGSDFESAKHAVSEAYAESKTIRPRGTRQNNSEVFVVGLKRR